MSIENVFNSFSTRNINRSVWEREKIIKNEVWKRIKRNNSINHLSVALIICRKLKGDPPSVERWITTITYLIKKKKMCLARVCFVAIHVVDIDEYDGWNFFRPNVDGREKSFRGKQTLETYDEAYLKDFTVMWRFWMMTVEISRDFVCSKNR